ncbi:MAG TPA: hypothetical protein VNH18_04585 [Bryobacteraceae bacterium]|nr:hypothetical protein [Bryobacteraceae bacterium]
MTFLPDASSPRFAVLQDIVAPDQTNYQNASTLVTGTLLMKDGTKYLVDTGLVRIIEDRNGNKVTFNYATVTVDGQSSITPYVTSIVDPLQRTISIEYDYIDPTYGTCDRITYSG